jgi:hypothetical protein
VKITVFDKRIPTLLMEAVRALPVGAKFAPKFCPTLDAVRDMPVLGSTLHCSAFVSKIDAISAPLNIKGVGESKSEPRSKTAENS